MTEGNRDTAQRASFRTAFGQTLSEQLTKRGLTQKHLAASTGSSPAAINQRLTGYRSVSPQWADFVADVLKLTDEERLKLHRSAALDHGFKIDLTKTS